MALGSLFEGKGFLIAGVCSQALRALGRAVADQGAHVVLCGPRPPEADDPEPRVTSIAGDVTQEEEVERLMEGALEALPGLDGVVIVMPAAADEPLAEMDLREWSRSVLDPLRGCFLITRRAVEEFLSTRTPGRIVLVSGWHPAEGMPAPQSEVIESALFALARSIAKEYGRRGVACNLVAVDRAPSPAALPTWAPPKHSMRQLASNHPGAASPLIEAIHFLACEESSYVNGERMVVNASGAA